jgi:hypothetical protein
VQALQQSPSRVERGQVVSLAAEVLDALAAGLELRAGQDLTEPYRWVYGNTGLPYSIAVDPITWLGGRLPVFTSVANAHEARGWVTFAEGRVIEKLVYSHPYEVFHTELRAAIGDDDARMVLDPSYETFCELAGVSPRR